jgi:hypothetical protein
VRRWGQQALVWGAIVALLVYGVAPALACLLPHRAAPAVCLVARVHTCSCRPDPHAARSCCCGSPSHGRAVGRLPCEGGSPQDGSLWTRSHPFTPPAVFSVVRLRLPDPVLPAPASRAPRSIVADVPTPPPRLQAAA